MQFTALKNQGIAGAESPGDSQVHFWEPQPPVIGHRFELIYVIGFHRMVVKERLLDPVTA